MDTLRPLLVAALLAAALLPEPACARAEDTGPRPPPPPVPSARAVAPSDVRAPRSQSVTTDADTGLPLPGTRFTLTLLQQLDTRIGAGVGEYEAARATASLRIARNVSRRVQLNAEASFERGRYDFDQDAALVPLGSGTLGGEYTGARLALGGSWSITRTLGVTLGASLRSFWMDGADVEDGVQPGGLAAVRLRLFGTTDVFIGASFTRGLEGDPSILPILGISGIDTGKTSRWRVEARGTGVSVAYLISPRFSVGLSGGYERRDIRLADDDRLSGGVLRERRLPIGFEVAWQPRACSSIILTGGASLWNKITLLDRDGEVVLSNTTDPAPFVQLEWSLRL